MTDQDEFGTPHRLRDSVSWRGARRFALVLGCTTMAFWNLLVELLDDMRQGSDIGYVFPLAVLAFFAAVGISLRHGAELPIYDRQSDIIVGLLGLAGAAALIGLLVLRYPYEYEVLHLDLLAAPLFLMSVSILVFGLRPVFRFWPAWLLLLFVFPWFYRGLKIAFGGDLRASGLAMLVPTAVAAAIAAGRTRPRALVAALVAVAIGATVLALMLAFTHVSRFWHQAIPPVVAMAATTAIMYLYQRNWSHLRPLDRPVRPLTAAPSRTAIVVSVTAAALIALIPLPAEFRTQSPNVPGLDIATAPATPPGWQLVGERDFPWVTRYFGPNTSWVRQQLLARHGTPLWDKESRRRRIMVDVVRAGSVHDIDRFPEFTNYLLDQPRVTKSMRIDLGHGVVGRLNTVLDDRRLLSWTWLTWYWQNGGRAERVSLIAADNHLPTAEFPEPEPWAVSNVSNLLHQFLRGNAVTLDPESDSGDVDFEVKDIDMLTAVAREMVRLGAGG